MFCFVGWFVGHTEIFGIVRPLVAFSEVWKKLPTRTGAWTLFSSIPTMRIY